MKDKKLQMRVDDDFLKKAEYLRKIYGCDTISGVIRLIIDKEYRKEK